MRGLPSFACCFALLTWIWYQLEFAPLSPVMFGLMGPAHWAFGSFGHRKRKPLLASQR